MWLIRGIQAVAAAAALYTGVARRFPKGPGRPLRALSLIPSPPSTPTNVPRGGPWRRTTWHASLDTNTLRCDQHNAYAWQYQQPPAQWEWRVAGRHGGTGVSGSGTGADHCAQGCVSVAREGPAEQRSHSDPLSSLSTHTNTMLLSSLSTHTNTLTRTLTHIHTNTHYTNTHLTLHY